MRTFHNVTNKNKISLLQFKQNSICLKEELLLKELLHSPLCIYQMDNLVFGCCVPQIFDIPKSSLNLITRQ